MEFIRVSDALKRLNSTLEEISQDGHIKTLLNKYRFLEMDLYVSNDNGESIVKANELQKEIYYDCMDLQISDKIVFGTFQQGISLFIFNEIIKFKEKYYWKADDFYGNSLFKKLEIKKGDVVYYSTNLNEEDLERLADKALKNKIDELEQQLQAKDDIIAEQAKQIAELQSQIDSINNQLDEMSERTETNYLITIGLLLELLKTPKGFDKDNKPNKPLFESNNQIIQNILDYGIYGQGASTLETRFAKANNALNEAQKK